jgi:hypothetical protein
MLPARPLDEAGKYVAGAYLIFLALLFVYVAIMASKLSKIEREVVEISQLVENRSQPAEADARVKEPVG